MRFIYRFAAILFHGSHIRKAEDARARHNQRMRVRTSITSMYTYTEYNILWYIIYKYKCTGTRTRKGFRTHSKKPDNRKLALALTVFTIGSQATHGSLIGT